MTNNLDMEDLVIVPKKDEFDTPSVNFSASTGECFLTGESYLENTFQFYDVLIRWIEDYFKAGNNKLSINFKLSYFNTSSSRAMLDLLKALRQHQKAGMGIVVRWHYPDPDLDDMLQEGEEFAEDADIEMEYVAYLDD